MIPRHQQSKILITGLLIILLISGCHNFYEIRQTPGLTNAAVVDSMKKENRYFILRNGSGAFLINNLVLSADQQTIQCTLAQLPPEHRVHLTNGHKGKMQYRKNKNEQIVLNEVHLFIAGDTSAKVGLYTLSLNKVQKIEVLEKDKDRTTSSYILGGIGYTLGSLVVAAVIIAATKSSCPFVSAYDGNQFVLQGEIYGGAIYPQLARDDYMPLRMQPLTDGSMQLKISNELQEKQYTDVADLYVIAHNPLSKIISDEKGKLYEIADPQLPVKATLCNQKDVLGSLLQANDNQLLYFDDTLAANAINYTDIVFKKPTNATSGKLLLSIKNAYWLDYLYGDMAKNFGTYYTTYMNEQSKKPAAEVGQWSYDQHLPLTVLVKTGNGWKKITDITTIGPVATRETVVAIDLSQVQESTAEIRLSSGFMFWEIDYAAMDYTADYPLDITVVHPSVARDENGKNVLPLLSTADGQYLEQPMPGNVATLQYHYTPAATNGKAYSYILHTRGYYTHIRDFQNPPDLAFLKQFKQPGAFTNFSLLRYKQFRNTNLQALAGR